jgi:cytochrome P450
MSVCPARRRFGGDVLTSWPGYITALPYGNTGSLLTQLDPTVHGKRRRLWDRAFTPGAIATYEPLLQARVRTLLSQLDARTGQSVDIAEWLGFATLDFMSDFACGSAFDATARGADVEGFHALAVTALRGMEALGAVPWTRPFVARAPSDATRFRVRARRVLRTRRAEGSTVRDLFYHLVCLRRERACVGADVRQMDEDDAGVHAPLDDESLAAEASLAIVAGSDTTSTALANALFYLISHPTSMARLREELDGAAAPGEDVPPEALSELAYLQAVLNETLRLQPAVPNGVQRTPPPAGGPVVVAGHVVPVGTAVQIPTWSSMSSSARRSLVLTALTQSTTTHATFRPTRTSFGLNDGYQKRVRSSPQTAASTLCSTRPHTCRSAMVGHPLSRLLLHLTCSCTHY